MPAIQLGSLRQKSEPNHREENAMPEKTDQRASSLRAFLDPANIVKLLGAFAIFLPLMTGVLQFRQASQQDQADNFRAISARLASEKREERLAAASNLGTFIKKDNPHYRDAVDLLVNRLSQELDVGVLNAIRISLAKIEQEGEYKRFLQSLLETEKHLTGQEYQLLADLRAQAKQALDLADPDFKDFKEEHARTLRLFNDRDRDYMEIQAHQEIVRSFVVNFLPSPTRGFTSIRGLSFDGNSFNDTTMTYKALLDSRFVGVTSSSASQQRNRFDGSSIVDSAFLDTDLGKSSFRNCVIERSLFLTSQLKDVDFSSAELQNVFFKGSDVDEESLDSDIVDVTSSSASQQRNRFDGSKIVGSAFLDTDLSGSSFRNCDIEGSLFLTSQLKGVDFSGAKLWNVSFKGSDLDGATFESTEGLEQVHFLGAKNLEKARFDPGFMVDHMSRFEAERTSLHEKLAGAEKATAKAEAKADEVEKGNLHRQADRLAVFDAGDPLDLLWHAVHINEDDEIEVDIQGFLDDEGISPDKIEAIEKEIEAIYNELWNDPEYVKAEEEASKESQKLEKLREEWKGRFEGEDAFLLYVAKADKTPAASEKFEEFVMKAGLEPRWRKQLLKGKIYEKISKVAESWFGSDGDDAWPKQLYDGESWTLDYELRKKDEMGAFAWGDSLEEEQEEADKQDIAYMAVCDEDCREIEIALFGGADSAEALKRDSGKEAYFAYPFTKKEKLESRIEVRMIDCDAEPCFVTVFRYDDE